MNRRTVLVVDDEQSIVESCERLLQKAGFGTLSASDAAGAIRLVKGYKVDCVLTDIMMPKGLGGIELFIALRQVGPDVPIVVMSGVANVRSESFRRLADQFGVKEVLSKPFSAEDLIAAIYRSIGAGEV